MRDLDAGRHMYGRDRDGTAGPDSVRVASGPNDVYLRRVQFRVVTGHCDDCFGGQT